MFVIVSSLRIVGNPNWFTETKSKCPQWPNIVEEAVLFLPMFQNPVALEGTEAKKSYNVSKLF